MAEAGSPPAEAVGLGPLGQQQESRRLALRLCLLEISGFKVYSSRTVVGPMGNLTCIIGPNGIGKSVLGEALAFALGANARMLRVKSLSGVISTGCNENGEVPDIAQVSVHFTIDDPISRVSTGQISVRRQVNRSGRTLQYAAVGTEDQPILLNVDSEATINHHNAILDNDANIPWRSIKPDELKNLLLPYGLQLEALERVIVTQHRRAVEVADPKKLVKFIETLIGGGGAREELDCLNAAVAAAQEEENRLDKAHHELVSSTEELAPALQQWKRFSQSKLEYLQRLAVVTKQRARGLERQALEAIADENAAKEALEGTEAAQEDARNTADELLLKKEEADAALNAARVELERLVHEKQSALEELEKAKVRERSASAAKKRAVSALIPNGKDALAKLEKQVIELQQQGAKQRAKVEEMEKDLKLLQATAREEAGNSDVDVQAARQAWKEAQARSKSAVDAAQSAAIHAEEGAANEAAATTALKKEESALETAAKASDSSHEKVSGLKAQMLSTKQELAEAEAAAQMINKQIMEHQQCRYKLEAKLSQIADALANEGVDLSDPTTGCSRAQSMDAAVASLAKQAQHESTGPLAGAFHGRMHSVLRVTASAMSPAVNAVLLERCNPAASVVTSTRTAAEAVIEYYRKNQIGRVTCEVLEELRKVNKVGEKEPYSGSGATRKQQKSSGNETVAPLSAFIEGKKEVQGSDALLEEFFGAWDLVPDAATAHKMLEQQRAATRGGRQRDWGVLRNYVTMTGALFKHDGEIVGERSMQVIKSKGPYLLKESFVAAEATPTSTGRTAAEGNTVEAYMTNYAHGQEALKVIHSQLDNLAGQLPGLLAAVAKKKAQVMEVRNQYEAALRVMQRDEKALRSAQGRVESARCQSEEATAKAQSLDALRISLEAEAATRLAEEHTAHDMYLEASRGDYNAQMALEVEQNVIVVLSQVDDAKKEMAQLETRQKEFQENRRNLVATETAAEVAERRFNEATSEVAKAAEVAAKVEAAMGVAEKRLKAAEKSKKKATEAWREAVRSHQDAVNSHQRTLATIQQAQSLSVDCYKRATDMARDSKNALSEAQNLNVSISRAGAVLGGTPDGRETPSRAAAPWKRTDSDMETDSNSDEDSDSDFEEASKKRRKRSVKARSRARTITARRSRGRLLPTSSCAQDPVDEEEEWEEEEVIAALAELAQQERALTALGQDVDHEAMREAIEVHTQLVQVKTELEAQEAKSQDLGSRLAAARTARYHRFSSAMDTASQTLSSVFQKLTGGQGDAHCRYAKDEDTVFEEGVKFIVRPDSGSWRDFGALSGGQQALAALALCLALQSAAPSPFYFFDEIDAALDTINAQNLAQFLKETCDVDKWVKNGANGPMPPQIVAVSHRPAVQRAADIYVGVYMTREQTESIMHTRAVTVLHGDTPGQCVVLGGLEAEGQIALVPLGALNGDKENQ